MSGSRKGDCNNPPLFAAEAELLKMLSPPSFIFPPSDLTLGDGEVDIWSGALDQPVPELHRFIQTLSADERIRTARFHFQEDRKRFIVRHGMLRMILGCYLGVEASELQFCYGKNRKPAIVETFGKRTIRFNLSHSNGVAIFAFARDREIGVDIEYIRNIPEMEQIAERFFSIKENEILESLPKINKKEAFYNAWVCKEAIVKALGDGLSRPLDKFDVSLVPGEPAKLLRMEGDLREASRWSIQYVTPAPNYVGAIAVRSRRLKIKRWRWEIH
jgi:4'-phosphopantetheinyl transferase